MSSKAILPEGWTLRRFDQMAENINEHVLPADAEGLPYVGLEHLDSESLKIRRWGSPDEVEAQKLRFYTGDIVFGKRRYYQKKLAVADFDGICSAHAMVLRAKPDVIVPEFLPFFMQSEMFFERAMAISVGSLSPTINWTALARQEFLLPPRNEQHRIAEVLWAIENAIETWNVAFEATKRTLETFREEQLSATHFERQKLGNHLRSILAGKSVLGTNVPAEDNEYGVLKVSAVGASGFVPSENKRLIHDADFIQAYSVHRGDLLITRANTTELVGRVCIVPSDYNYLMLSDKTLRLDPQPTLLVDFLLEILRTKSARKQIETAATGTSGSMKNISQVDIKNLLVPIPDIAVQKQLIHEILSLHQSANMISEHIAKLTQMKTSIVENWLYPSEVAHVQ
ncbi:MAG: restriction endonuclease subunit S [Anaerolineae bacterium]